MNEGMNEIKYNNLINNLYNKLGLGDMGKNIITIYIFSISYNIDIYNDSNSLLMGN